jgi:AcrR family transcriptional regulator
MISPSNSVNMDSRRYHHGNLRTTLIAEGLRLLAERDVDALSLREVARAAGVSATAVYRHFPDKDALMRALAREGLDRLATAQRAAAESAGGGSAAFAATGRAYVRFALANPALFRLIFASPHLKPQDAEAPDEGEPEAMTMLRRNAAAATGRSPDDPEARVRAVHAWSLVHGLAMLMLDRQVEADDSLIDAVIAPELKPPPSPA